MEITPPVSPSEDATLKDESDPFFRRSYGLECNAETERNSTFNNDGLVKCGEGYLIFNRELLQSRNKSTFKLFGAAYEADSSSCTDLERLFFLARKRLYTLAAAPKSYGTARIQLGTADSLSSSDCAEFRNELKDFFKMLRYFLASHEEKSVWMIEELAETIKKGVALLRLELGWLVDLPRFVLEHTHGTKSTSAYQLFHTHLELRWFELTILCHLHSIFNPTQLDFTQSISKNLDNKPGGPDLLKNAVLTNVIDLTRLAVQRFQWANSGELVSKSIFNCPCVKELWLLLIIFIGKIDEGSDNKHPFWALMDEVLERISLKENKSDMIRRTDLKIPDEIGCGNPSLFALWLLRDLAELFLYDDRGNLQKNKLEGNECNYLALKRALIQLTGTSSSLSEEDRRVVVHLVRVLLNIYEPKPDAIMILWEFFYRSLDSAFQLPGSRAGNFAVLSDSPRGLLLSVSKLSEKQPSINSNTSYDTFLHLVGNYLEKNPLHWKQKMRGRVFSKLSPKKFSSLSELGLWHLIQFFLTVAMKTDLQDVVLKLNELLSSIDESSDLKRKKLSALARLAMVMVMAENGLPFGAVIKPLIDELSLLVGRGQLEVPRIIVDSIEDVMKCNNSVELDQHLIVGSWISQYLQLLNQDSYHHVLYAVLSVTKNLRSNIKDNYGVTGQGPMKFAEALRLNILPFVKEKMCSSGPAPFLVADLAAHLTFLSLEILPSTQSVRNDSFNHLIKKFVDSDSSNIMLTSRYLWLIFKEKSRISNVFDRCSEQEVLIIIQAWFRVNLFCPNFNHEEIRELTHHVFNLSLMSELLGLSVSELEQISISEDPFISLLDLIEQKLNTGKNPVIIRRGIAKILQPLDPWLKNIKLFMSPPKNKDGARPTWIVPQEVMGQPSKEALSRLYFCIGSIFYKCPSIIFEPNTADCLLVKVVPKLLLPASLYDFDTQLAVPLDDAIRSSLHLFVVGLSHLGPHKEPCIKRYFRDTITVLLPRMTIMGGCMGGIAQKNPFIQVWSCSTADSNKAGILIIEFVAGSLFDADKKSPHPQYSQAVKYIQIVLKEFPRNENLFCSVITHIVPRALEISSRSFDQYLVRETNNILQILFSSPLYSERPNLWSIMDGVLNQLSAKHLSFNPDLYFRLLSNLGKEFPHIVKRYLPTLKRNVENAAKIRGVGNDRRLQTLYTALANAFK